LVGQPVLAWPALAAGAVAAGGQVARGRRLRERQVVAIGIIGGLSRLIGPRNVDIDVQRTRGVAASSWVMDRRTVVMRQWTRGRASVPARIEIRYHPAIDAGAAWQGEVLRVLEGKTGHRYQVAGVYPRRRLLSLRLDPSPAPQQEMVTPAQARLQRGVATLIGPTARTGDVVLDGEGQIVGFRITHDVGAKLAARGYRIRVEKTLETMLPGRWRAHWDLEGDTVRFEVRPALPRQVWLVERGAARPSDFEPLFVFIDEYTEFINLLRSWYATVKIKGDPSVPRTLDEVASLLRLGRTGRVHLVITGQRPDVALFGTGEMRDNLGQRASMGRLSPKGAEMMWESASTGVSIPRGLIGRMTTTNDDGLPVEAQAYRFPDFDAPDGSEETQLLQQLRPTQAVHERLLILPAQPVGESEVVTWAAYANAPWVRASDRPDLDPLLASTVDDTFDATTAGSTLAMLGLTGYTPGLLPPTVNGPAAQPRPDRQADARRGDRGREAFEAGQDDEAGSGVGAAPGPGEAGVHRERPEPALGHRPDIRADLDRRRLRVLHHRRVQQDDRGLAGRVAHANRDGPRRGRDGPLVPRRPARGSAVSQRRRLSIHLDSLWRTPRRDRCHAVDWDRWRQL
jgi:hypothetical protein